MVDYLGDTPHSMDSDQRGQCDAYWQGRIQDLKLGVAQMDGEFQNTIIIVYIFQIRCTSHTIFITVLYIILSPLMKYCIKKGYLKKN